MANADDNPLGTYLKYRRAKLDPTEFGFSATRRRTPGLRREEVALRANVSATWYTWLEQGRGGTPSADVLDGLANALALSAGEREYLFLLAQQRPPQAHYQPAQRVTPQLQRVLDSLEFSPSYVRTPAWDVVAWNRATEAVLTEYAPLTLEQPNLLRMLFSDPRRRKMAEWASNARTAVAAFRSDVARAGASESVAALVAELCRTSPEFKAMWRDQEVQSCSEFTMRFCHSTAGPITLEYSSFAVDSRPDLRLVIYTPATAEDAERIRSVVGN